MDWWKQSHTKGIILKLDFKKAYDSVNWDFLLSKPMNMGFGCKWVSWMKECISSAGVSILVNGSPTPQFTPEKGLRQGDPLSPFLFNIVTEGLNVLLTRAKDMGLIRGIKVGSGGVVLSHLLFANDTIIFCEADWYEVSTIKRILRCFELMSGLKINFHKSSVSGVGVADELVSDFAAKLHYLCKKLPLTYLGLPLGASPRKKST